MSKRLVILALLGLSAGGLIAFLGMGGANLSSTGTPASSSTGKALIGGSFQLLDPSRRTMTEKDFAGKPMLVMFGFTSCPDICPSGLQVMAATLDLLGDKKNAVAPIFISLDPERDTPEVVGEYVRSFDPSIVGLTGTLETVDVAAKAYRVYYKKVPLDGGESYSVDHSSFFYVMDRNGQFASHAPHTVSPENLAARVKAVIP